MLASDISTPAAIKKTVNRSFIFPPGRVANPVIRKISHRIDSYVNNKRMNRTYRIGQIVPSSNTTMETEIPAMLRAREAVEPERFTFHSSRMRMKKVTKEELAAMDADSGRCASELVDARV